MFLFLFLFFFKAENVMSLHTWIRDIPSRRITPVWKALHSAAARLGPDDLLTGLVFIPHLRDAYQTLPQTWPGPGLRRLSDCCSLSCSIADVFVPPANKVHVLENRSRCRLTCLSLAFLQGRERERECVREGERGGRLLSI